MRSYTPTPAVTKRLSELTYITDDEASKNNGAKRHARRNFNRAERSATRRALKNMAIEGWTEED